MTTLQPEPGEHVDALNPSMDGRWIVKTQGSEHVWDLDLNLYERHQLDGLNPMRCDRQPLALPPHNVLRWPEVGQVFIILVADVSDDPHTFATMRTSSLIVSITRSK